MYLISTIIYFLCAAGASWSIYPSADIIHYDNCSRLFDSVSFSSRDNGSIFTRIGAFFGSPYIVEDSVVATPHVLFLLSYLIWWARQQTCRSKGLHLNGDILTTFLFKTTLASCSYLILANTSVLLWNIYTKLHSKAGSCLPFHGLPITLLQVIAWIVTTNAVIEAKRKHRLFFPCILRMWWIVAFILLLYSSFFELRMISKLASYASFTLWVSMLSCPAAFALFVAAIIGSTGIQHVKCDIQEPLLPRYPEEDNEAEVTPYYNAGILSILTISWLDPLLSVGSCKHLELRDIPLLASKDRIEASYVRLKAAFKDLKLSARSETPLLTKAIATSFWQEAGWSGAFAALNTCASYVGPFLITDFVEYLSGRRRFKYEGYALALLFMGSKFAESLSQRQCNMGINSLAMHVRGALTAFVYRKGLRLSTRSRQSHSGGEIINYMSVDVQRIGDFSFYLHDIWILPLQIILALGILYRNVGVACIATLTTTIFSIIANTPLARLQEKFQDQLMTAKDERMRATSECLRSMRILKLQAWEDRYRAKLEALREEEYGWLRKTLYTQAAVTFIFWGAPIFVSVATFGTCIVIGIPLTAGRVLSALATFRILQEPLRNFPDLVAMLAQTKVSLERVSSFLEEEELPRDAVVKVEKDGSNIAIEIKDGIFSWDPSFEMPTLSKMNVSIQKQMRVAVCGKVGAGKTSFLACILGEMPKLQGMVRYVFLC